MADLQTYSVFEVKSQHPENAEERISKAHCRLSNYFSMNVEDDDLRYQLHDDLHVLRSQQRLNEQDIKRAATLYSEYHCVERLLDQLETESEGKYKRKERRTARHLHGNGSSILVELLRLGCGAELPPIKYFPHTAALPS
jgi:hypothetical protein